MSDGLSVVWDNRDRLIDGFGVTLQLTLVAAVGALILGTILAAFRVFRGVRVRSDGRLGRGGRGGRRGQERPGEGERERAGREPARGGDGHGGFPRRDMSGPQRSGPVTVARRPLRRKTPTSFWA